VAAAAIAAGAGWTWRAHYRLRFACVEEGVLYRSAQPNRRQLERIVDAGRIRTIVNLRQPRSIAKDPRAADEKALAAARGIDFVNIPYAHDKAQAQIAEFLALVADPARRPILVHCSAGKERTGVLVAAYRMKALGWKPARAMEEMGLFGYDRAESVGYQADLDEFVKSLRSEPWPERGIGEVRDALSSGEPLLAEEKVLTGIKAAAAKRDIVLDPSDVEGTLRKLNQAIEENGWENARECSLYWQMVLDGERALAGLQEAGMMLNDLEHWPDSEKWLPSYYKEAHALISKHDLTEADLRLIHRHQKAIRAAIGRDDTITLPASWMDIDHRFPE